MPFFSWDMNEPREKKEINRCRTLLEGGRVGEKICFEPRCAISLSDTSMRTPQLERGLEVFAAKRA
jgi:hypothetical protein